MTERPITYNPRRKHLRVLQVNVARTSAIHDTALRTADEQKADVLLIQEPWCDWIAKSERQATKSHPNYHCHSPVQEWRTETDKPRVLTYTRTDVGLEAIHYQLDPGISIWLMGVIPVASGPSLSPS